MYVICQVYDVSAKENIIHSDALYPQSVGQRLRWYQKMSMVGGASKKGNGLW